MGRGEIWIAVIGSAAVGVLVSSIITEIGRWRERKSRREELALGKAIEMAQARLETLMRIAEASGEVKRTPPEVLMVLDYYISLKHVLDKGELDPGMWSRIETNMKKYGIDINKLYDKKL